MKIKTIALLLLVFVSINVSIFYLTKINTQSKIDIIQEDNLRTLKTYYDILLHTQSLTAEGLYKSTIEIKRVIEIIAEANGASKERKAELRDELHKLLVLKYKRAKVKNVLQYHFVLKSNESFYRAHKPSKFGDDLTDVRFDFKKVNEIKRKVIGFTQGRTTHGFRNTFPLFDENSKHIGAMEVSFSSDSFQWYLNKINQIHSHFLVDKNIFDTKAWKRDDLVSKYEPSAESKSYMLSIGPSHTKEVCIDRNRARLKPIAQKIESDILLGKEFSQYFKDKEKTIVVSFVPIKNIENRVLAWIVSYEESKIISSALENNFVVRFSSFLVSLLIVYMFLKQILSKREIENQHKLLNDILNTTDNMMFITNFNDVKFSNNKFKDTFNVHHSENFNKQNNHNILNMFIAKEGYLHEGMLDEEESFVSLIANTSPKDRVVALLDKNFEEMVFKISVSKSENSEDYLVTLTDVTKMQEYHMEMKKKVYMDGLTKVYNRKKFDESLNAEIEKSKTNENIFSIAILDIDKFKNFNDTYGHLIGDEVLISMAQMLGANIRESDVFARWGGEEFAILFKNSSANTAEVASQKLREMIELNEHPTAGKITASFGVTEYVDGDTLETIFKRCDDALYMAKENGRNRVEVL